MGTPPAATTSKNEIVVEQSRIVELPWEFNLALEWEQVANDDDEEDFGGVKRSVTNPTFVVSNSTGHNWVGLG
jgi:hypothetical protein